MARSDNDRCSTFFLSVRTRVPGGNWGYIEDRFPGILLGFVIAPKIWHPTYVKN